MPNSLLVITGIFPPDSGGPARFSLEFAEWASTKGFHVQIQTYSDQSIEDYSYTSFRLNMVSRSLSLVTRYLKMIRCIGRSALSGASVLSVGAFLETYFASIVYGFTYVAKVPGDIVWERARNNGMTNLGINEYQDEKLNLKYRVFRNLYTKSLRRARVVIVPSKGLYNLCIKWGVSESRLRLIFNSIESKSWDEKVEKRFDLITVCRLTPWKGVDELIEYASRRQVSLLILGDGPERQRLETLASTLNAKAIFKGEVAPQLVNEYLLQSKLFVLNSYYEGLPHALVEARAAGVLSVGRAGTGSEEVINDDVDGFLIRPNRSLDATLDNALAMHPNSQMMISEAKVDTSMRFSKASNFPAILNQIQNGS
jgi:glycosyltransferase involved in cell wall biosynthesis